MKMNSRILSIKQLSILICLIYQLVVFFIVKYFDNRKLINENNDNEFITNSDVLIIAFHHAAFDRSSFQIFFNDLCMAYNNNIIMVSR